MKVGPENRVVYVSYPNKPACTREAQFSLTRPLTFGNHGAPVAHKLKNLNFADHGRHILGDAGSYHNRMAREAVFMYWNFGQYAGLTLDDPFDMIRRITYTDETGDERHCEPPKYHPIHDAEEIAQLRGRYQWHKLNTSTHRIVVLKKDLLFRQQQLKCGNLSGAHRNNPRRRSVKFRINDSREPSPAMSVINESPGTTTDPMTGSNQLQVAQPELVSDEMVTTVVRSPPFPIQDMPAASLPLLQLPPPSSPSLVQDVPIAPPPTTPTPEALIPITPPSHTLTESRLRSSDTILPRRSTRQSQSNRTSPSALAASIKAPETISNHEGLAAQPSTPRGSLHISNDPPSSTSGSISLKRTRSHVDTTTSGCIADPTLISVSATKRPRLDTSAISMVTEVDNGHSTSIDEPEIPASAVPTSTLGDPNASLNTMSINHARRVDADNNHTNVDEPRTGSVPTPIDAEIAELSEYSHNQDTPRADDHTVNVHHTSIDVNEDEDENKDSDSDGDYDYRDDGSLDDDEYEVDAILESRIEVSGSRFHHQFIPLQYTRFSQKGRMKFLVRWKGYSDDHNYWLTKHQLRCVFCPC